ncbi:MAG: fibrillarin [Candidatus Altiarchaeales archaeon ex4484_43]|nr:MAG: fibrillarin [Candidatus Altiarchaeales archaeon ex4484_43]RLI90027.1 MAG: fibrillarin-like rRNA/tRNA 2'-O-methyltransferase [Candidatus Altiarchaeales archaeon]
MKTFTGIYRINGKLATLNSSPGYRVYDEKLIHKDGREYRLWDPYRSKLSAAIIKGLKEFPFGENSNVLYLGASSGTTASHIADICPRGLIYCVEFSKRMMRELLPVAMKKRNMIPILADATRPGEYIHRVASIDIIYQDVAQSNQTEILIRNSEKFSPRSAMLIIKSRSINATKSPKKVFKKEIEKLRDKFDILQTIDLRPYDKDHILVNLKVRK